MSQALVTIPLGIPDIRVLGTEINERGEVIITVESTQTGTKCRCCGQWIDSPHGHDEWVIVRHLPVFGRPTYLRYRPRRYRCQECEGRPTTTERLVWHEPRSAHTIAYDDHILLSLVNSTIEDVSIKEGVSYDSVLGALERRMCAEVDWSSYERLDVLGLDEIALKKGHRDFVVIVTARLSDEQVEILGVLPDRKKNTVIRFLHAIPEPLQATIHTVCCDMYKGYIEAVRQVLKTAHIVIDRFHVAKQYHAAADTLRKQELKRLKHELPEAEYKRLKGSMWAFRKNPQDLKPKEREVLQRLFEYAPKLKLAYDLRQQLTDVFEQNLSKKTAKIKLRSWIKHVRKSGLKCFDAFIKTLLCWLDEIAHYFVDRANSGFVEGFNNKIKVLKRRCYGIFNLRHLFQRIYLDLTGYRLFVSHHSLVSNHGNSQ